ncbi:hypothetical protein Ahy_B10g101452 [Arachis hypogaea]|uniref:RNase H type-1 domain-containing protein n=1 Tax=Arachis hypogaea TaxID=3818 RepID=A0A444WZS8_ARAHY|nr:hypothetical protein Ahy_B10g101452 [Arachis hypogaea]
MFLWKAMHGILPVNASLYHREIAKISFCSICQQADETVEHALLLCPWTRAVWFRSSLQFLPTVHNVTSFGSWVINTIAKIKRETAKDQEKILCKLGCVCWCIWKERNQHIFQQSQVKPEKVIFASEHLAVEFYNAIEKINNENRSGGGRSTEKKRVTWRPPPKDWLKVNTDAAFHRETGMAASAVVARDWRGKIVSGLTTTFKSTSCLAVEAQAYREALILIKNLQLGKCIIETDCLPLVQAIKAKISLAETDAIIRDTLHLLNEAPAVGVTWTPRDGNKLAHQLASMAAGNGLQRQWIVNPHAQIKNTIRTEVGFATLQQEQNLPNHTNLVPFSTSHQRQHREEILPVRVGVEPGESEEAGVDDQTRAFGMLRSETGNYNEPT